MLLVKQNVVCKYKSISQCRDVENNRAKQMTPYLCINVNNIQIWRKNGTTFLSNTNSNIYSSSLAAPF
jgi:hypothetical protein